MTFFSEIIFPPTDKPKRDIVPELGDYIVAISVPTNKEVRGRVQAITLNKSSELNKYLLYSGVLVYGYELTEVFSEKIKEDIQVGDYIEGTNSLLSRSVKGKVTAIYDVVNKGKLYRAGESGSLYFSEITKVVKS